MFAGRVNRIDCSNILTTKYDKLVSYEKDRRMIFEVKFGEVYNVLKHYIIKDLTELIYSYCRQDWKETAMNDKVNAKFGFWDWCCLYSNNQVVLETAMTYGHTDITMAMSKRGATFDLLKVFQSRNKRLARMLFKIHSQNKNLSNPKMFMSMCDSGWFYIVKKWIKHFNIQSHELVPWCYERRSIKMNKFLLKKFKFKPRNYENWAQRCLGDGRKDMFLLLLTYIENKNYLLKLIRKKKIYENEEFAKRVIKQTKLHPDVVQFILFDCTLLSQESGQRLVKYAREILK